MEAKVMDWGLVDMDLTMIRAMVLDMATGMITGTGMITATGTIMGMIIATGMITGTGMITATGTIMGMIIATGTGMIMATGTGMITGTGMDMITATGTDMITATGTGMITGMGMDVTDVATNISMDTCMAVVTREEGSVMGRPAAPAAATLTRCEEKPPGTLVFLPTIVNSYSATNTCAFSSHLISF
ncbi:period circadian protein [Paralichthys olivaceus]|uniref:period circadian protein n=1 Tax=Paralichthys olivaceus TaxID=8255 RepID=UPI00374FFD14